MQWEKNITGLGVTYSVLWAYDDLNPGKKSDANLSSSQVKDILKYNCNMWRKRILTRIEFMRYVNKVLKIFFWILLLAYPSVSVRILRLFACEEIGHVRALTRDYTIMCYTQKWEIYAFGAIIAGILYIIGIPVLFLSLLYNAREHHVARHWRSCLRFPEKRKQLLKEAKADAEICGEFWTVDKDGDGDQEIEEEEKAIKTFLRRKNMRFHRTYNRLGFLYYAYNEHHWWYETVELSRKLVLNGCIVLVPQGIVTRVTVGMLLCFLYMVYMQNTAPYTAPTDHNLASLAHVQLFLCMMCAMFLKLGTPWMGISPTWRPIESTFMEVLLISTHACVILYGWITLFYEKFFSKEARLIAARQENAENARKRLMSKMKRVKKKALLSVKSTRALSAFGGVAKLDLGKLLGDDDGAGGGLGGLLGGNDSDSSDGSSGEDNADDFNWGEDAEAPESAKPSVPAPPSKNPAVPAPPSSKLPKQNAQAVEDGSESGSGTGSGSGSESGSSSGSGSGSESSSGSGSESESDKE